jgi:uncharacterized protein YkwD
MMTRIKGMDHRKLRALFWTLPAALTLGCSLAVAAVPGSEADVSLADRNAFLPPTNTPFLPNFATHTIPLLPSATQLPTVEVTQTPAFTIVEILTATDQPTATLTIIILPSVTPTNPAPAYNPPTATKYPKTYPSATPTDIPTVVPPATEAPAVVAPQATATPSDPAGPAYPPPDDGGSPAATEDASGGEPPSPMPSPTPTPTNTPLPTATTGSEPANPFPGCTYYLNVDFENQIFERINQARADAGLWSLSWYGPLAAGARYHSIDMGCNKYFAHTGGVYENILGGYNTVEQAWNWWWNSPPHHDNILGRYYYKCGVGYANVTGSPYRWYWTIQFSR